MARLTVTSIKYEYPVTMKGFLQETVDRIGVTQCYGSTTAASEWAPAPKVPTDLEKR
jgi:hypothetical protein